MRIVVDLPAPLGPRKPKTSPLVMSRSTPRTASMPPSKVRLSFLAEIAASAIRADTLGVAARNVSAMSEEIYLQRDQPDGVPPLELTGERTLPDLPEENYWYRRHLAVYEWIAARSKGLRVADLAC